jgi:hypothetical protein
MIDRKPVLSLNIIIDMVNERRNFVVDVLNGVEINREYAMFTGDVFAVGYKEPSFCLEDQFTFLPHEMLNFIGDISNSKHFDRFAFPGGARILLSGFWSKAAEVYYLDRVELFSNLNHASLFASTHGQTSIYDFVTDRILPV